MVRASVLGREVPAARIGSGERFGVLVHAPRAEGVAVTIGLAGPGPVALRAVDGSDGLAGLPGAVPRPPGTGVAGSHDAELVLVGSTRPVDRVALSG